MGMESNIKQLSIDDWEQKLKRLLEEGYVLVRGEMKCVMKLEKEIYTPGTEKNRGFLAMLLPTFPPYPLFLAKKTKGLKEGLWISDPRIKKDFDKLIAITFFIREENESIAEATFLKEEKRQESIHNIIKQIKSYITGLEVV